MIDRNKSNWAKADDAGMKFLVGLYSAPRMVKHWAQEYEITPRVVTSEFYGDGKQLVRITPMFTRPQWYIARIDSSWAKKDEDGYCKIQLSGHLDEWLDETLDQIYSAMESNWADLSTYAEGESSENGDDQDGSELDGGSMWELMESPEWDEFLKSQEVAE